MTTPPRYKSYFVVAGIFFLTGLVNMLIGAGGQVAIGSAFFSVSLIFWVLAIREMQSYLQALEDEKQDGKS